MAFNVSSARRSDAVVVDASLHAAGDTMGSCSSAVGAWSRWKPRPTVGQTRFVRLNLGPHQFAILQ